MHRIHARLERRQKVVDSHGAQPAQKQPQGLGKGKKCQHQAARRKVQSVRASNWIISQQVEPRPLACVELQPRSQLLRANSADSLSLPSVRAQSCSSTAPPSLCLASCLRFACCSPLACLFFPFLSLTALPFKRANAAQSKRHTIRPAQPHIRLLSLAPDCDWERGSHTCVDARAWRCCTYACRAHLQCSPVGVTFCC